MNKGDIEFYNPHGHNTKCTAQSGAEFIMSFKPSWTRQCHRDFYSVGASWSEVSGLSHRPSFELWNRCSRNVSEGISLFSTKGDVEELQLEYEAVGDDILESFYTRVLEEGKGVRDVSFAVDADHSYVSALVRQVSIHSQQASVKSQHLSLWSDNITIRGEIQKHFVGNFAQILFVSVTTTIIVTNVYTFLPNEFLSKISSGWKLTMIVKQRI